VEKKTPNLLLKMVVTRDGEEDGDLTSMVLIMLFFALVFVFNMQSYGIRLFTRLVEMRRL